MKNNIANNIQNVMERIERASRKSGRDSHEITLIAASKTTDPKQIKEAIKGGIRNFGENYVQEATSKIPKIRKNTVHWHLLGKLQKNKVNNAIKLFDSIHTIDSIELAGHLNKRLDEPMDVLVEVNLAREKSKGGVTPKGAIKLIKAMSGFKNLNIKGLMAIPPFFESAEYSRPYFISLRRLAEQINRERFPGVVLSELSMGMSGDFEVAIEEGATIVRVGTAIFGSRDGDTKDGDTKDETSKEVASKDKSSKVKSKKDSSKKKKEVKNVTTKGSKKPATKAKTQKKPTKTAKPKTAKTKAKAKKPAKKK